MSVQNPTIPTATQSKGIDAVILDLQTHLDFDLDWLTNGMGRAYRLSKVRTNQSIVFLPEVYLGTDKFTYFAATPDNDKKGQSIFIVGNEGYPNQQLGFYGLLEYDVSIIFSVNLKLVDPTLLETEYFDEHQIEDVRESLIRNLLGKAYKVEVNEVARQFEDVYSEFDVTQDRGISHAPMSHFRFNCTVTLREDCAGVSLNRCGAILQNLSATDKNECILPTYDFSDLTVQGNVTAGQQTDLIDWLCAAPPETPYRMQLNGINQFIYTPTNAALDFEYNNTFSMVVRTEIASLQTANLVNKLNAGGTPRGYFFLMLSSGKLRFDLQNDGTTTWNSVTTVDPVVSTGIEQRLGCSYDGSSTIAGMSINVDGVDIPVVKTAANSDTLGTNTIVNSTIEVYFGINHNLVSAFNGYLDESLIWNVELTPAEFLTENARNINDGSLPPQSANVVCRGKMGEGAVFGVSDWAFPEESGTLTGLQSANCTLASRVVA